MNKQTHDPCQELLGRMVHLKKDWTGFSGYTIFQSLEGELMMSYFYDIDENKPVYQVWEKDDYWNYECFSDAMKHYCLLNFFYENIDFHN